jgi:hypothetical protein
MIEFYSYENWHHEYARVHRGDCRFCNHARASSEAAEPQTASGTAHTAQPSSPVVP